MKRQRTRPPLVVVPLWEDPDDHPRPAVQTQGEQAGFLGNPRGPFAKPLPRQSQGIQPLRATTRRPRQHRVPSTPEGKAAVNRLLVTNGSGHPYPFELGTSSVFRLAVFGEFCSSGWALYGINTGGFVQNPRMSWTWCT